MGPNYGAAVFSLVMALERRGCLPGEGGLVRARSSRHALAVPAALSVEEQMEAQLCRRSTLSSWLEAVQAVALLVRRAWRADLKVSGLP